ncbi:hypothetical protein [Naasia aerilata]|uniref:Uncharacterized protein n=1 Tax=Naasia aerilata TaxID=1162966 RepID=A0ABN6XIC9_9MICO|nr:hypothetical protein [Naasia aerilata]BDZ44634.1 hypothetical protein GCM10025866_05430 [Naasia aerilata]
MTPTPTPSESAAPAAALLSVTAESVSVQTADGAVLASYDYRRLTSDVVADLSGFLGEPTQVSFPQSSHQGGGITYQWDGFRVSSEDRWATIPDAELPTYEPRWWIAATAPSARGLAIQTIDGVRVGDSTQEVLSSHPEAVERVELSELPSRYDFFLGPVPPPIPEDDPSYSESHRWSVWVFDEDPTDVLQEMRAPSANFGA